MHGHGTRPTITEAPSALVEHGRIRQGFFRQPCRRVDLLAARNLGGRGRRRMRFGHDLARGRHRVHVEHRGTRRTPPLHVDLTLHQDLDAVDPLVVSLPVAPDHHTYTHKSPLRLEGSIVVGGEAHAFDPARDLGNLDEQKTFYPYRSRWLWGSVVTRTAAGPEVMVNLVDQMTPADEPGEDALWVDGRLELLPKTRFVPLASPGAYRLENGDGTVALRFTPVGAKVERRNLGLVALDYVQNFGPYEGEVVDAVGVAHHLAGAYGALERMAARF